MNSHSVIVSGRPNALSEDMICSDRENEKSRHRRANGVHGRMNSKDENGSLPKWVLYILEKWNCLETKRAKPIGQQGTEDRV